MNRLILLLLSILMVSALPAYGDEVAIELRYDPTPVTRANAENLTAGRLIRPVNILPFTDGRTGDLAVIGEKGSYGQQVTIRTKTNVAVFASDVFRRVHAEWGGVAAMDAPLQLKGEVTSFLLEDTDGYRANVGFHFYLSDSAGKLLWDGSTAGIVKGSGRSLTVGNYSEILSDVLREAYGQLLDDEKLLGVWSGKVQNTVVVNDKPAPRPKKK